MHRRSCHGLINARVEDLVLPLQDGALGAFVIAALDQVKGHGNHFFDGKRSSNVRYTRREDGTVALTGWRCFLDAKEHARIAVRLCDRSIDGGTICA